MRLIKWTAVFTVASLAQGYGASQSTQIASLGWLIGTLLSLGAGGAYGAGAGSRSQAIGGGAVAGGVPILIGCGVAWVVGPVPFLGLVAAVMVGTGAGALSGLLTYGLRSPQPRASA